MSVNIAKVGQKIENWNGSVTQIIYSLKSENSKKYVPKLNLLNEDFARHWENIYNILSQQEEIKTKKGGTKKVFKYRTKASVEKDFKGTDKEYLIEIWEYFYAVNNLEDGYKIKLEEIIKKYDILKTSSSASSKAELSTLNKTIRELTHKLNETNSIGYSLIHTSYPNIYEFNILSQISKNLSQVRQTLFKCFKRFGSRQIEKSLWCVPTSNFEFLQKELKEYFYSYFEGTNEFIKMYYLFWLNDESYWKYRQEKPKIANKISKQISELRERYEQMKIDIEDGNSSNYPNLDLNIFMNIDEYDLINKLWDSIDTENIKIIAEILNARNLKIKRKEISKGKQGVFEEGKIKDVEYYWYNDNPNIVPYREYIKEIKYADRHLSFKIDLKTSLLLHEINDQGWRNAQYTSETFSITDINNTTYYGYDALFHLAFTILNLQSSTPSTTNALINIFTEPLKEDIEKLDSAISENINKFNDPNITPSLHSIRKSMESQKLQIEELEKSNQWLTKFKNTNDVMKQTIMKRFDDVKQKLKRLENLLAEEYAISMIPQNITIKINESKKDEFKKYANEIVPISRMNEFFNTIDYNDPTSNKSLSSMENIINSLNILEKIDKIYMRREDIKRSYNSFVNFAKTFKDFNDNDKKDKEKISKFINLLRTKYISLISKIDIFEISYEKRKIKD